MPSQEFQENDFCGVRANRDNILEKTELPRFSAWWERLIESLRETERPSLESIAFADAVTEDEALGQKAIGLLRETLAGAWWGNAPNSNWCSHLLSGLGLSGLVLMEDDAEEAQKWIDTAKNAMIAMLDLAGEEGAGIESTGYWCGCYRMVHISK